MKIYAYLVAILFICHAPITSAAGKCTEKKLASTQKKVSIFMKKDPSKHSNGWQSLRKSFDGNRDCMAVFETYDFGEAVRHTFKNHWDQIAELEKYKREDGDFFQFVISGLTDETADVSDIKYIIQMAKLKCPKNAALVCKEIGEINIPKQ